MGEIINLRRARKSQARAEAERQAAENRILHGEAKALRKARTAQAELEARRLDGQRLAAPAPPAPADKGDA